MHVREVRDDVDVLVDHIERAHLVILRAGRNLEAHITRHRRRHFLLQLAAAEVEADARRISLRLAVRVIVQVGAELPALANPAAHAFGIHRGRRADGPHAEHVDESRLPDHPAAKPPGHEQHGVMRDLAIARPNLEGADPAILWNVDRQVRRRKHVGAVSGHVHRGQRDDVVGLAELPAFGQHRHGGFVGGIAARRAGIHPLHDRVDVFVRQPGVVLERAMRRIGEPRRHLAALHLRLDRSRPGPHFVERAQRHRRHFAGAMTRDAVGVEDRRDVFRERHWCGSTGRGARRLRLNADSADVNNSDKGYADENR